MKKKVVVAMSGGVDSSVAAALLKKNGFRPIGLFLKFWTPPNQKEQENKCCSVEAAEAARRVAQKLDMPFYVLDFRGSFKKQVVDYFISEYKSGRTPNPCVKCNQFIKFGKLLKKTKELGAEFLATGHYVRVIARHHSLSGRSLTQRARSLCAQPRSSDVTSETVPARLLKPSEKVPRFILLEAKDKLKDQSYFLWTLKQEQLKHLLFPIGDYTKAEVRKMAKKWQLPTAARRESQEICFVFGTVQEFLKKYIKIKKGKILDLRGKPLGEHEGAVFYTIGQRHSLLLEPKTPDEKPYYVVKTDVKKNLVVVGHEKDLYSKELAAEKTNLSNSTNLTNFECQARIRYGHPKEDCRVKILPDNKIKVIFKKRQRAITSGQSVVFYRGREVLGGGIIKA